MSDRLDEIRRLRKTPGYCARCARPHDGAKKTCDDCLARIKELYGWKKLRYLELKRRIESIELAVARLQTEHKKARNRAYSKGYEAALRAERRPSHYEPPVMSMQEAAMMSHAYDHGQ